MILRSFNTRFRAAVVLAAVAGLPIPLRAQDPAPQQPQPAASQPAGVEAIMARVIEVHGEVDYAPLRSRDWKRCKVDDKYPPETKVRTGVRSSIKFQIGDGEPYTALMIESAGAVVISEAHKTSDTKRVRIGVGYGRIRAGVAEGGLKSDFTVDSPVATLSKRGTWNFGLAFERGTDRFEAFLLDRGLVDVLKKITRDERGLLPGELVTEAMRRWFDEAQIRRNVAIADILGQEDIEVAFNRLNNDGLGVLGPGGGRAVFLNLTSGVAQRNFAQLIGPLLRTPIQVQPIQAGNLRPEGFFGTGRGDQLLEVVIQQNNPLAQAGLAKAGRFKFRRSALEGWMKNYNKR